MTDMTDTEKNDLADRLSGTATPEGVLIPWEDAQLMLEGCLEDAVELERLAAARHTRRRRRLTDDEVKVLLAIE